MAYYLIRLTSKSLKKHKYNLNEVKLVHDSDFSKHEPFEMSEEKITNSSPQIPPARISADEHIKRQEKQIEKNIEKALSDSRTMHEELSNDTAEYESDDNNNEKPAEKKNVLKMLLTPKSKSNKTEDNSENETEKKKFSIWEEIPEEPRDTMQLEAAKLINQDGYYDTVLPIDINDREKSDKEFNWKIPMLILIGLLALGFLGYTIFM